MTAKEVSKLLIGVVEHFTATVTVISKDDLAWQQIHMASQKLNHLVATTFSQTPDAELSPEFLSTAAHRLKLLDGKIGELDLLVLAENIHLKPFDDVSNMERLLSLSNEDLEIEVDRIERQILSPSATQPMLIATTASVGYPTVIASVNAIKESLAALILQLLIAFFPKIPKAVLATAVAALKAIINRWLTSAGNGPSIASPDAGAQCLYEVRLDYILVQHAANTGTSWKFDITVDGLNFNQPERSLDSDGTFPISRKVARIFKPGCGVHQIKVVVDATQFSDIDDVGNGEETFTVNCGADDEFGIVRFRVLNTGSTTSYSTVEVGFDIESECLTGNQSSGQSSGLIGPPSGGQ